MQSGQINKVIFVPLHTCVYVPNVTCVATREHNTREICLLPVLLSWFTVFEDHRQSELWAQFFLLTTYSVSPGLQKLELGCYSHAYSGTSEFSSWLILILAFKNWKSPEPTLFLSHTLPLQMPGDSSKCQHSLCHLRDTLLTWHTHQCVHTPSHWLCRSEIAQFSALAQNLWQAARRWTLQFLCIVCLRVSFWEANLPHTPLTRGAESCTLTFREITAPPLSQCLGEERA